MNQNIHLDYERIKDFCTKWQVRELSLFGSATRDDFNHDSDLDFLVSFYSSAKWSLWDLMNMKEELEIISGRSVDLIEKEALRNPWRKREILNTYEVVYAA